MAKNFATVGKAWGKNEMYVRRQDGSFGCSSAHERFLSDGWAEDVIGFIAASATGSVFELGKSIGDTNGLRNRVSQVFVSDSDWKPLTAMRVWRYRPICPRYQKWSARGEILESPQVLIGHMSKSV